MDYHNDLLNDTKESHLESEKSESLLTVSPGGRLIGEVGSSAGLALPGDKSLSHRAALLAGMAHGTSIVRNFLVSGVTEAMLGALTVLAVPWSLNGNVLTVRGIGLDGNAETSIAQQKHVVTINCGNSATTLRLLAGAIAAWGRPAVLDGSTGLRRRPMRRIIEPLRQMDVAIEGVDGCAPISIGASGADRDLLRPLKPFHGSLPVASAQVKSCLLIAGLAADGDVYLDEPGPSRDHTERMLRAMGVVVTSGEKISDRDSSLVYWSCLTPPVPRMLKPLNLTLPGDMSAAAFLIVAALISPASQLTLRGVGLNPSRTGLLDTLLEMGAEIEVYPGVEQGQEPVGDLVVRCSRLHGVCVSGERVVRMIDEFPAFAVAAACASGETIVSDAQELRHKELDRISALGGELQHLGIDFNETADGFIITGGRKIRGGAVESHGDHRLAMALGLAGLVADSPITIRDAGIIRESFPDFVRLMNALGVNMRMKTSEN